MRKIQTPFFITLLQIMIFCSCQPDKEKDYPEYLLQPFSTTQTQCFDIGTGDAIMLTGEAGTKIWFERNFFNLGEDQNVTLVLREFYGFRELLFHRINTITDDNRLLRSSGVVFLDLIDEKGASVSLRKNQRIPIHFPDNRLAGHQIFYADAKSPGDIRWKLEEPLYVSIIAFDTEYRIDMPKTIPRDSLSRYHEIAYEKIGYPIMSDKLKWINIDAFVEPDGYLDVEVEISGKTCDYYTFYVLYKGINSFISYQKASEDLFLSEIPIVRNTRLLVVGQRDDVFYFGETVLKRNTKRVLIQTKPIGEDALREQF